MTKVLTGMTIWCRQGAGVVTLFGLSLMAVKCGSVAPQEVIDRSSFMPCPGVPAERNQDESDPSAAAPVSTADDQRRYLATGTSTGTYVLLGEAIARNAKPAVPLTVCTTNGSSDNLTLLRRGKVDFALVQLDTLHYAIENETGIDDDDVDGAADRGRSRPSLPTTDPARPVSLVTFLYSEKLHVFVRPHLYLNSLAELAPLAGATGKSGRTAKSGVWLGPPRSGGRDTALKVLEAAGMTDDIEEIEWSRKDARDWNVPANCLVADPQKTLNAYFRTMAVPRHAKPSEGLRRQPKCPRVGAKAGELSVDDLLQADAQLMPLPPALIDRLTADGLYVRTAINLGTYRSLRRGVPTIGIPTVLLTNLPDAEDKTVEALIGAIQQNKAAIEQDVVVTDRHKDGRMTSQQVDGIELDQLNRAETFRDVDPHRGALKHLRPDGRTLIWVALFMLGALAAGGWRNPQSFRQNLAAGSYLWILSASLAAIWILVSLQMMQVEGRLNPAFATFGDSLLNTLGLVTRLREYPLMTQEGEIWRWLGLFLFPVILGWLFSDVIKDLFRRSAIRLARAIQRGQWHDAYQVLVDLATLPKRLLKATFGKPSRQPKGPLVFLNWNSRAAQMAQALRQDTASVDQPIIVVRAGGSGLTPADDLLNVSIVDGDPAARETMERAGIVNASEITILSAWAPTDPRDRRRRVDPEVADTKTIRAILAIRALCEDRSRSRPLPIKAEIRLTRNEEEARHAADGERVTVTCLAV
jgi:TRAP-type uncharacterized transport system substrate-binding protein